MQLQFFSYTMDSIMQIFFGEKVDTLGGQANAYAQAYDTAHRSLMDYIFASIASLTFSFCAAGAASKNPSPLVFFECTSLPSTVISKLPVTPESLLETNSTLSALSPSAFLSAATAAS